MRPRLAKVLKFIDTYTPKQNKINEVSRDDARVETLEDFYKVNPKVTNSYVKSFSKLNGRDPLDVFPMGYCEYGKSSGITGSINIISNDGIKLEEDPALKALKEPRETKDENFWRLLQKLKGSRDRTVTFTIPRGYLLNHNDAADIERMVLREVKSRIKKNIDSDQVAHDSAIFH